MSEGGGAGCIPQFCTDSKKEMCSGNPDCRQSSATPVLSSTPPPPLPPGSSPASCEGGASSCVLVFVRVFLFVW